MHEISPMKRANLQFSLDRAGYTPTKKAREATDTLAQYTLSLAFGAHLPLSPVKAGSRNGPLRCTRGMLLLGSRFLSPGHHHSEQSGHSKHHHTQSQYHDVLSAEPQHDKEVGKQKTDHNQHNDILFVPGKQWLSRNKQEPYRCWCTSDDAPQRCQSRVMYCCSPVYDEKTNDNTYNQCGNIPSLSVFVDQSLFRVHTCLPPWFY